MFESLSALKAEWHAACDAAEMLQDSGESDATLKAADEYVSECYDAYVAAAEREAASSVDGMERTVSTVVLTELSSGILMARADGPAGVWFSCSRSSFEAAGNAVASAAYGDVNGNASMDAGESLRLFYSTNR